MLALTGPVYVVFTTASLFLQGMGMALRERSLIIIWERKKQSHAHATAKPNSWFDSLLVYFPTHLHKHKI